MTRLGATAVLLFLVAAHLTAPVAADFNCTNTTGNNCQYPGCSDVSNGDGGVYTATCQAATDPEDTDEDPGQCRYSESDSDDTDCPDPVPCEAVQGKYCDYYTSTTCNTSSCGTGQYMGPCGNDTDATCVHCDSGPEDALYTGPGKPSTLTPRPSTLNPQPSTLNQVCLSTRTTASGSVRPTSSLRRCEPHPLQP